MSIGQQQKPGLPWQEVAASAYRAYAHSTGGRNFRGDPMPAWSDLPRPIRIAWEAAVRQVGDVLEADVSEHEAPVMLPHMEIRWIGWEPPGWT